MKRAFSLVLLCLALTACGAVNLDAPVGENPLVQASPVMVDEIVVKATEKPIITLTAIRTGTPTPDYPALIGAAQLENAQSALRLQDSLGTATMSAVTEISIVKTSTVLQSQTDATATATVAKGHAKDTATAAYWATADERAARTQSAASTATVQAPLTQKAQADADFEPYFQSAFLGGVILLILILLWFAWQVGQQLVMLAYEKRADSSKPVPAVKDVTAAPVSVQLDQRDQYGWGSVDWFALPIDTKTLHEVAELLTNGQRYTQAQMTGSGRPLVKDASFNTFGDWMVKYGIAAKIDGRYVISHPEFFTQVLERC